MASCLQKSMKVAWIEPRTSRSQANSAIYPTTYITATLTIPLYYYINVPNYGTLVLTSTLCWSCLFGNKSFKKREPADLLSPQRFFILQLSNLRPVLKFKLWQARTKALSESRKLNLSIDSNLTRFMYLSTQISFVFSWGFFNPGPGGYFFTGF